MIPFTNFQQMNQNTDYTALAMLVSIPWWGWVLIVIGLIAAYKWMTKG